jgi:hypothetical protein
MAYSTRPTLGATRARQGRFGRHVVWVLLFGTLLAALGLFAAWTWRAGDLASTEPNNAREQVDVGGFRSPPPDAASRQNYQEGGPLAPSNGKNPGQ